MATHKKMQRCQVSNTAFLEVQKKNCDAFMISREQVSCEVMYDCIGVSQTWMRRDIQAAAVVFAIRYVWVQRQKKETEWVRD